MKTLIAQIIEEEIKATSNLTETLDQFVDRVYHIFSEEVRYLKLYAPMGLDLGVAEEIKQEITDTCRVKIYGHYNLQNYRLSLTQTSFLDNREIHGTIADSIQDIISMNSTARGSSTSEPIG